MSPYSGPNQAAELPHNRDAECAVLGALMLAPDALAKVSDFLGEDDFHESTHRLIFRAVTELSKRGEPCDAVTLADWFEGNGLGDMIGGASYLIELANNTPGAANVLAYGEIVREKSALRRVIETGRSVIAKAMEQREESQIIIANASHELSVMSAAAIRTGLEPAKGALKRMHNAAMERMRRGPGLIGLPTPWPDLNECLNGLRDSTLYIVGARPSMGKTVFGLQMAINNALNGHRTAFFSVEMGAEEIMARAVACTGRIPHKWVEHPNENAESEEYWPRYTNALGSIMESDFLIDETPMLSVRQLMARARRAHMQKPLRLIVVDHMHDMEVSPQNARFDYGIITQAGKTLAKEFKCPVIILAQLKRSGDGKKGAKPVMSDLRESGEIEQKADVILFLHRDDYYEPSANPGMVEVIPAKGRNIKTGDSIRLQNEFHQMRLGEYAGGFDDVFDRSPPPKAPSVGMACDF